MHVNLVLSVILPIPGGERHLSCHLIERGREKRLLWNCTYDPVLTQPPPPWIWHNSKLAWRSLGALTQGLYRFITRRPFSSSGKRSPAPTER
jgi:hypothetical protein